MEDMPVDDENFLSSNFSSNVDTFRATGDEKMADERFLYILQKT
jgi:hypothetical protein